MCHRDIRRLARLDGHGDTDDLGFHVVETRRLGIERDEFGLPDRLVPAVERFPVQHGLVLAFGRWLLGFGFSRVAIELAQQHAQLEATVQFAQGVGIGIAGFQIGEGDR